MNQLLFAVFRFSRFRHGAGGADEGGAFNNSMADIALRAGNHRTRQQSRSEEREPGGHANF